MAIVSLMTCNNLFEANLIKTKLVNEDIECFLTNENFTTLMPGYNGMMGAGIQVMIDEKDYEKAISLISHNEGSDVINCPNCNSTNVTFGLGSNKFKKLIFALFSIIYFIPFNNIRNNYYCKDCNTDFSK